MSTINITPASLFDATFGAHQITVSKIDKHTKGGQVLGEMVVWITLGEIDPQQIDNDLTALYAIDELFEAINDSEKAVEIFGSEYIKFWSEDKQCIHIGNGIYVCNLSYSGDLPYEDDDYVAPAPGTRAYQLDLGIPDRSA